MTSQPPHDINAEQCVLGAMLMSDQAIADVAEILGPGDHYRPAHQIIHEAILCLRDHGQRAEPVAVKDELRRRKQLRQMGGAPYLHTLLAAVPTAANAAHYARIVAEMADRRRAIEDAERLKQQAESPDAEFDGSRFSTRDWDAPVPLGSRRNVPEFPVDVLPRWIADMVRDTAIETQTPADIPGTLALAALSTAAGGRVQVRVRDGWSEPVNLYLAAIAEPGTRKSAVYQAITLPLSIAEKSLEQAMAQKRYEAQITRDRLEKLCREAQTAAVNATGHDIPNAIEKAAAAAKELETAPVIAAVQLITGDISPEECTTILAAQGGRLAIMSAEGRIFDIITGRYSNGQPCLSPFLEGHAGDPLRVNRRERHEVVEHPALTIGVCIQPAVLTEVMTKPRLRGQGMLARILYALPPDHVGRRVSEPPATAAEVRDRYAADLEVMVLSLAQIEPPTLTVDDAALKIIVGYLDEIEPRLRPDGDLYGIRDWAAKLAGAAVRIAGLLHVAEHLKDGYGEKPIAESTMARAITIASYYAEHALAAFGVMSAHPSVRLAYDILAWRRPPDGPVSGDARFTQRDAHRKFEGRVRGVGEIAAALRLLEDHGYIRPVPQQGPPRGGGRPPSPAYSVIPYSAIPLDGRQNRQNPENGG